MQAESNDSWYVKILQDSLSPFTTPARNVFIGGSLITAGFYAHKQRTNYDFLQSEYGEDKPQGTFSQIGDYSGQLIPNALYAAGMLTHYWITDDDESYRRSSYMFRATLYPAIASSILKFSFEEKRPSGGKYSFPSGHTTTAFAFATAVACEHAWYWGVPAFGLATFVGMSRMNDNKHYFHDVLAGATLGISYALGLHYLERDRKEDKESGVSIYPFYNYGTQGLAANFSW